MGHRSGRHRDRIAELLDQPARERPGTSHGHLLAEDGPDRELEPVPCAGDTQAGAGRDERREDGIAAKRCFSLRRVCSEVEGAFAALDDPCKAMHGRSLDSEDDDRGNVFDFDDGDCRVDPDRPPIRAAHDLLDPGNCAIAEEGEQAVPRERWSVGKPQPELRIATVAACGAELRRGATVRVSHGVVEPPCAREAGCSGDLGHGQLGLVDQLARKLNPPRTGDCPRGRTEVSFEESAQLTFSDADLLRQLSRVMRIEEAVGDQAQRACDDR